MKTISIAAVVSALMAAAVGTPASAAIVISIDGVTEVDNSSNATNNRSSTFISSTPINGFDVFIKAFGVGQYGNSGQLFNVNSNISADDPNNPILPTSLQILVTESGLSLSTATSLVSEFTGNSSFSTVTLTSSAGATQLVTTSSTAVGSTPLNGALSIPQTFGPLGSYTLTEEIDITANGPNVSLVSDSSVSAVPESSTWAMMILGFMGIGFLAYRRKTGRNFRIA
jgi:hypothetical protein